MSVWLNNSGWALGGLSLEFCLPPRIKWEIYGESLEPGLAHSKCYTSITTCYQGFTTTNLALKLATVDCMGTAFCNTWDMTMQCVELHKCSLVKWYSILLFGRCWDFVFAFHSGFLRQPFPTLREATMAFPHLQQPSFLLVNIHHPCECHCNDSSKLRDLRVLSTDLKNSSVVVLGGMWWK